ncbi:kinase-like protein [Suillus brevipes Sb2]|nr:kinase-like protein [Suillus brevipes Sb2]
MMHISQFYPCHPYIHRDQSSDLACHWHLLHCSYLSSSTAHHDFSLYKPVTIERQRLRPQASRATFPIDNLTANHSQTITPILVMQQEMVSSSSTTNVGAQHRSRPPRSTTRHRQHPYIIPGRKPPTQKLRRVHENSSFGMDTGAGPLAADQRRSTSIIEPSLPTTPNVTPFIQPITTILIPDLTKLITRCSPDPISGGTYGNIYKCIYRGPEGDVEVAVKAIRPQFFSAESFRRELGIWKRLRHSNILKFMGTTSDFGDSVALVAPWMTNGTLTSFLDQNNETLRLHDRLLLLRDIAAGLNYLHTFSLSQDGHADLNPVVHGDLTGTNVLIDGDRKAYLADFGLSGTFKKLTGMTYLAKLTGHPGAVRWAAPELLSGEESTSVATTQSDMYSFGNIMLQVLTGNVPWCHLTRDFQISYQVVIEGKMHPRPNDAYVTDQHWNFMARCWSMTFPDRPPANEAVEFVGSALHTSTNPQSPTLSISGDERAPSTSPQTPTTSDDRTPSTSPQTPTLSISSDERRPVMQDIDLPLDARKHYSGVMLSAYPSTTYTTSLDPSCKTPYRY